MTDAIVIDHRFHGPPASGNGGYSCGLVANAVGGDAEVTLRLPPPIDRPLTLVRGDAGVQLLDGDAVVADGHALAGALDVAVPAAVGLHAARRAGEQAQLRLHPEEHPFPTCFVCGPKRPAGEGLDIIVGEVPGRDVSADVWIPAEWLGGDDGVVHPEFVWAALDCPSGIGAFGRLESGGPPYVLGRLAIELRSPVRVGEPHVALGWRIGIDGRKLFAGSALLTANGACVGLAKATWVRLQ